MAIRGEWFIAVGEVIRTAIDAGMKRYGFDAALVFAAPKHSLT